MQSHSFTRHYIQMVNMNGKAVIVVLLAALLVTALAKKRNAPSPLHEEKQLNAIDFGDAHDEIMFWGPHNFPNPGKQKAACEIPIDINENVCDPDSVFTDEQIRDIAYVIQKVNDYPSMCMCDDVFECGEQSNSLKIGVAIVRHMAHNTTKDEFAEHLRTHWKLGDCNNNLLIFVSTEDRAIKMRWGLRGSHLFLRDFRKEILKDLIAMLRAKSLYIALITTLENIYDNLIQNHM